MFSKERLLDVLRYAHQQEIAFIDRLTPEQRDAVGRGDDWSAKDVIAHLSAWKARLLDRAQAAARGEKIPRDERSDDEINAEIYREHELKSWSEVRQMSEDAFQRVSDFVTTSPDDVLTDPEFSIHDDGRPLWQALLAEFVSHTIAHLWDYHFHQGDAGRAVTLQEATAAHLRELDEPAVTAFGVYNLACVYARAGRTQDAIRALDEALRLRPQLTAWSKEDSDLDSLRGDPAYQALYR